MNSLDIRLFGKIVIQQHGRAVSELPAKAMELLAYLLLHCDRAHTREALAELLWPETSNIVSKKYLRQTLWQLQTALEFQTAPKSAEADALFILTPGWVRFNTHIVWQLDVNAFEAAFAQCCDCCGADLSDHQSQALEAAVMLYQGDLMEMWYQDWCIFERDRLQQIYLAMLDKLMGYCEATQRYAKGLTYGQRILRVDAARESTHRQLMRLHYKAGDRTGALHQFERCAAALAKEFNLEPTRDTRALHACIRNDCLDDGDVLATTRQERMGNARTRRTRWLICNNGSSNYRSGSSPFSIRCKKS